MQPRGARPLRVELGAAARSSTRWSTPRAPSTCWSTRCASTATTSATSRSRPTCPRRSPRSRGPATRAPRVTETPAGMINAIGLENPGVRRLDRGAAATGRGCGSPSSSASGGNEPEQYAAVIAALEERLAAAVGRRAAAHRGLRAQRLVPQRLQRPADRRRPGRDARRSLAACRQATSRFLLAKLTPNVPRRHRDRRRAPLEAGADGLSLVNTLKAMVLDRDTLQAVPGQPHRRALRSGDQAHRPAHGRRGRAGVPGRADRRHGRRHDRPGRARVHRLRRHGRGGGRRQLHRASRRRRASCRSCATELAARGFASPAEARGRGACAPDRAPVRRRTGRAKVPAKARFCRPGVC